MSLIILNRVQRSQHLHGLLARKMKNSSNRPALALVHGRSRPADRQREFRKVVGKAEQGGARDVIVVATQAVEAGVDFAAAVPFSELAPWPSMVQRFGRANRYAELDAGADVCWIDLLANNALNVDSETREAVVRAARWHDAGKVHDVFQHTIRRGLDGAEVGSDAPLAKTVTRNLRHERS